MADSTTGTTEARRLPPKPVMNAVNGLLGALLRSPLHRVMGANMLLFSYTGRRTGRRYAFPLGCHRDGADIIAFAGNPWWKGFRAPLPVTVWLQGRRIAGTAQAALDPGERAALLGAFLRARPDYARYYSVTLGPDGQPEAESLRRAAERTVPVRIVPD